MLWILAIFKVAVLPVAAILAENIKYGNFSIESSTTEEYLKGFITDKSYTTQNIWNNSISTTRYSFRVVDVNLEKCPPGLTYHEHLTLPFCYTLTEDQTFPPKCPYENYLEYDAITAVFKQFEDRSIWVRARRDDENALGQFEWLEPSTRYLDLIKTYENPGENLFQKKCMIRYKDSLIPTDCTEKHPALCIYSYAKTVIDKFCSKRNDFYKCISSSLNLDNRCFCQSLVDGMKPPREAFCKQLAEPKEPFQSTLILTQLINKSPCWFGADQDLNGEFRWLSTNESSTYSYLKYEWDGSKTMAAFDYSKPKGWIVQEDNALTCAICEMDVSYRKVKIHLKHIPKENKIEARIQNVVDIHNYFLLSYVLACFTDSNTNEFRQKIISGITDIFSVNSQNYTKSINVLNYYPSYFWCETIQRPNLLQVHSNKILVYKDDGKHRHEYALVVSVCVEKGTDPYLQQLHIKSSRAVDATLKEKISFVNVVRPMKVVDFSETGEYMNVLLHLSTKPNKLSPQDEFNILFENLQLIPLMRNSTIKQMVHFSRSEVCLESETTSGDRILHWPETPVGMTVLPKELCLRRDSTPVVRQCEGDFLTGAVWSAVKGKCENVNVSEKTSTLYELLNSEEISPNSLTHDLLEVTKEQDNVLTVDIHFMAEILSKLAIASESQDLNNKEILQVINNMMQFTRRGLKQAQRLLNSTDKVLSNFDKILDHTELKTGINYITYKSDNVIVQISDLRKSDITGMSIHRKKINEETEIFVTNPLYSVSLEDLLKQEMDAAIFLPPEHIQEIKECVTEQNFDENFPVKLILTFFYDDTLFNEVTYREEKCDSRVISVFVPGFDCDFKTPIVMIFKPLEMGNEFNCGHWKYGYNDAMENTQGKWESDNLVTSESIIDKNNYVLCQYTHTTHFALLMLNVDKIDSISPESNLALNIITAIGCGLSLIGLAGIFITAILFKSWRMRAQNVIMLNFSISIAAQMILLFVSDNAREDSFICLISGASLHYTVLAQFAWMLIVAILQYRKFVLVFQKPISHLIVKCVAVGWCLPIIPVGIILGMFPKGYRQNSLGLCYPENIYFYYGVVAPVGTIVLINLYVFIKILLNICRRKVESYGHKDHEVRLQVLLAILLFFLLGMSWIFGLIATFTGYLLMSYLFCLTATMQGFVLFLFFVVMNKTSRHLWLNIQRYCLCVDIKNQFH